VQHPPKRTADTLQDQRAAPQLVRGRASTGWSSCWH